MQYRINRRTGDKISVIGIGSAYLYEADRKEGVEALRCAFEGGINYFDLAAGDGRAFPLWGEALSDVRSQVFYQIHFGADYTRGAYGWSLNLDTVKRSVDWQLRELKTDYIDYGFIHCQDEESDWETYRKNGILDYLMELKAAGTVRHIGLSSHTPSVIHRILDETDVDMLMFSVNPAYDYGKASSPTAAGISVMKPFCGGQLLSAAQSPFGQALTPYQCIRYVLDKPGVLTALCGAGGLEDVKKALAYFDQPEEALDYSVIGTFAPPEANGKCVYCNHCRPCPAGLDIGLINKYYDLAQAGDALAKEHYLTLEKTAGDCAKCGHCDGRCPFHVQQMRRMQEISRFFGK